MVGDGGRSGQGGSTGARDMQESKLATKGDGLGVIRIWDMLLFRVPPGALDGFEAWGCLWSPSGGDSKLGSLVAIGGGQGSDAEAHDFQTRCFRSSTAPAAVSANQAQSSGGSTLFSSLEAQINAECRVMEAQVQHFSAPTLNSCSLETLQAMTYIKINNCKL